MVLILSTIWIEQGNEIVVGEKFLNVMHDFPGEPFERAVLPLGVVSSREGTKVINIVDVRKGNYEKAIIIITKRMLEISQVGGVHYQIETLLSGKEAMSLISLELPQQMPM